MWAIGWSVRRIVQWNPDFSNKFFFETPRETTIGSKNRISKTRRWHEIKPDLRGIVL